MNDPHAKECKIKTSSQFQCTHLSQIETIICRKKSINKKCEMT
jgi:hypothetical protein